eukprot:m.52359 g.52359  ORF g.52359 m.52359 type:complete len:139 (+) comp12287_c0_seq2:84-500(+)
MAERREENAAELKFPEELEGEDCVPVFVSEVGFLLELRKQKEEERNSDGQVNLTPMFIKTLEWAKRFGQFKNIETVGKVRSVLQNRGLHKFEEAQLANLCAESVDEARALIPSLQDRISDQELEDLIDDLQSFRNFQT